MALKKRRQGGTPNKRKKDTTKTASTTATNDKQIGGTTTEAIEWESRQIETPGAEEAASVGPRASEVDERGRKGVPVPAPSLDPATLLATPSRTTTPSPSLSSGPSGSPSSALSESDSETEAVAARSTYPPSPARSPSSRSARSRSTTPSLAARIYISPFNPRNLPSLLLALLGALYAVLQWDRISMAIPLGLGKLWGRNGAGGQGDGSRSGSEMGDGDGDMIGEGTASRAQALGSGEGEEGPGPGKGKGEGKKVKRRRKGSVEKGSHYPGMVNLSGTLCYMNSVLQALASISSLINHLDRIYALAEQVDEPSMVSDALADVLRILNTAHPRPPNAIRPNDLLVALYELPAIRRLLGTREQQDAHELFMVLAEAVGNESVRVAKVVARSKGLGEVVSLQGYASANTNGSANGTGSGVSRWTSKGKDKEKVRGLAQPWEGLMARKRTCQVCGWSEGVRMDSLGGMELSLPQYGDVSLESCIAQYLAPEHLTDVTCEMCSLKRTLIHYSAEVERLSAPAKPGQSSRSAQASHTASASGSFAALDRLSSSDPPPNPSAADHTEMSPARRKRAKEAKKVLTRLGSMVQSGTVAHFGESLPPGPADSTPLPIKWQTSRTPSVREGLVTRPPHVLRLHLIRSEYTPYGQLLKKTARVAFPVFLDMTPLVSTGVWDARKGVLGALQARTQAQNLDGQQEQGQAQEREEVPVPQKRVIYRLVSVILHYGYTHSSGHYVCIRRKPVPAPTTSSPGLSGLANGPEQLHTANPGSSTAINPSFNANARADVPSTCTKSCPDNCRCEDCLYFGQARELDTVPGKGWLRVSDADVEEVGVEALVEARAQVSMLFYELVGEYEGDRGVARL